jgi:hypothetical protein
MYSSPSTVLERASRGWSITGMYLVSTPLGIIARFEEGSDATILLRPLANRVGVQGKLRTGLRPSGLDVWRVGRIQGWLDGLA